MWTTDSFYGTKEWITFRLIVIDDRKDEYGRTFCEHCGKEILIPRDIILHHVIELTNDNVNDRTISLNPDNIEIICFNCHNKVHDRFATGRVVRKHERGIYIVYGPPLSGKTSYVADNKGDNDLVVDMDSLYEAVTMLPRYHKPNVLKYNVLSLRNHIIDNIRTRYGKFNSAWLIGGYPNKVDRERLASQLKAEIIFIDASKEECYERLESTKDYRREKKKEWKEYIDKWFEEFRP